MSHSHRDRSFEGFVTVRDFEEHDKAAPFQFLRPESSQDGDAAFVSDSLSGSSTSEERFDDSMDQTDGWIKVNAAAESLETIVMEMTMRESHWRVSTLHAVHSPFVQQFLVFLLAVDIIALVVELFLDTEFPHCFAALGAVQCVANTTYIDEQFANATAAVAHSLVRRSSEPASPPLLGAMPECLPHSVALDNAHYALTGLSIVILCIFLIELVVLLISLGPRRFFTRPLYDIDCVVVLLSLALEITALVSKSFFDNDNIEIAVVLLLFARLWRFARIVHSVWLETYDFEHEHVKRLRRRVVHLHHKIRKLRKELEAAQFHDAPSSEQSPKKRVAATAHESDDEDAGDSGSF